MLKKVERKKEVLIIILIKRVAEDDRNHKVGQCNEDGKIINSRIAAESDRH